MYGLIGFTLLSGFLLFSFYIPLVSGIEFSIEVLIEVCVVMRGAAASWTAGITGRGALAGGGG